MPTTASQIERDLRLLREGPPSADTLSRLTEQGTALLPPLAAHLTCDLPIDVLERYESLFKGVLRRTLAGDVSGPEARRLATFQIEVGLLLKYKSYAVKASSPLGYSIFLQNPGEGFSFQRHVTHKVEVFHILDVHPGGFVFLCSFAEWERDYEPERFAAWLADPSAESVYSRYRIPAAPGDVFVLDELGIVHTAVGCILEEFANVSIDMVDRLHDQNAGRPIPEHFHRAAARERLGTIRTPATSRQIVGPTHDRAPRDLPAEAIVGGHRTVLADDFVVATLLHVEPGAETELQRDDRHAATVYVRSGAGRVLLGTRDEMARATAPSLAVSAGDVLTLPHGLSYAFVNETREPLDLVEHKIPPDVALIEG